MRGFAQEVIEHLIDSRGVICTKVQLDFIVDDNEHVWLSHIPSVELTQKIKNSIPVLMKIKKVVITYCPLYHPLMGQVMH